MENGRADHEELLVARSNKRHKKIGREMQLVPEDEE